MPVVVGILGVVALIFISFFIVGLTFKLVWTLLIGLIVGAIARWIMPNKDDVGLLATSLLGICGSFLATILGKITGMYQPGQAAGFIGSIVGALILLGIFRMVKKE